LPDHGFTRKQILFGALSGAAAVGAGTMLPASAGAAINGQAAADVGALETGVAPQAVTFGSALPPRIKQSTGSTRVIDAAKGNDSSAGTDAAPWRTLRKAFSSLAPGETALVKNGTYGERLDVTGAQSGTASAPKTLAAYPGHAPVLTNLMRPDGLQYWRFRGLTFAPIALDTGVYAVGATANLEFESCTFRDCPLGSGMVSEKTCSNMQWWRCTFTNNGRAASNNGMYDHGLYLKSANSVVANCIFSRNSSCGIHMYNGGPVNTIVANNTIVENGIRSGNPTWSAGIILGTDAGVNANHDNKVLNNIIAFNTGWGAKSNSNVQAGANNVFRRNLVFGNSLGTTNWASGGVAESETIKTDPKFVDRASGNYRLASGSSAIDASLPDYASATDYYGATRS
jgi:parallel beta-helix repeat protein